MSIGKDCLKIGVVLTQLIFLCVFTGMFVSDFSGSIPVAFCILFMIISIIGYTFEQERVMAAYTVVLFIGIITYVTWSGFHFARISETSHLRMDTIVMTMAFQIPVFIALTLHAYCCRVLLIEVTSKKGYQFGYHAIKASEFYAFLLVLKIAIVTVQFGVMVSLTVHFLLDYALYNTIDLIEPVVIGYLMFSFFGYVTEQKCVMTLHDWLNRLTLVAYCFYAGYSYQRLASEFSSRLKEVPTILKFEILMEYCFIFSFFLGYAWLCRLFVKNSTQPAVKSNNTENLLDV